MSRTRRPAEPGPAIRWLARAAVPGALRPLWAEDLARTIESRRLDARRDGRAATARFWARELGSLAWTAARWRLRRTTQPERRYRMFEPEDNRPYRVAWVCALVVHLLAFMVVLPFGGTELQATPGRDVTIIRRMPPPPPKRVVKQPVIKQQVSRVPFPDPTPDEPEPIVEEIEYVTLVTELPDLEFSVGAPVAGPPEQASSGPVRLGPTVARPTLLERTEPVYPELALRARLQCVVILEATIDTVGAVRDLEVLRGCGLGLDDAATRAVGQWRYAPTTIDGRPVEVLLTVTVRFELS